MLVLSRLVGEKIVVGENITIVVSRILPGRVVLGVQAPRNVVVMREELLTANSPHPRFSNQESEPINADSELEPHRADPIDEEVFTQELVIEFNDDNPSPTPSTPISTRKKSPGRNPSKQTQSSQEPQVTVPERSMPRQSLREFAQALLKAAPSSKTNSTETTYETNHRTPMDSNTTGNQQESLLPQDEATTSSYHNAHIVSEPIERCA